MKQEEHDGRVYWTPTATMRLVAQRVAQLWAHRRKMAKTNEVELVRGLNLGHRERAALRRYDRQLKSENRRIAGDEGVLHLCPLLAHSLCKKGLVKPVDPSIDPKQMVFLKQGSCLFFNNPDGDPTHMIDCVPTRKGRAVMNALHRMGAG